jgi:glutamate N-acetyltransferase/amino-acid N-acetyltransferase
MTAIKGGVCAAKGFKASAVCAGIKNKEKLDLALVTCEKSAVAAGVFTTNKVKAAPVTVSMDHLRYSGGEAGAVVLSSGNANACVKNGKDTTIMECAAISKALGIYTEQVLVAATGVIGVPLPLDKITAAVPELVSKLSESGNTDAAVAIMTTDTVVKEYAVAFELGGKTCHVGGMAKGSGMIEPHMATTLNVITTDIAIDPEFLQTALRDVTEHTYNCLYIDGDMSTNDTVFLLASGLAGNALIDDITPDYECFKAALYEVMKNLTIMLARDGEGATKLLTAHVEHAPSFTVGRAVAKSVIGSDLFKCAMFGKDANWGRILCAVGYAPVDVELSDIEVSLASEKGSIKVCEGGYGVPFSEEQAAEILSADSIDINIDLHQGDESATAWGCDLTYDYVKINGDYRS